jgi:hypothetical protein
MMKTLDWSVETLGREYTSCKGALYSIIQTRVAPEQDIQKIHTFRYTCFYRGIDSE